MPVVKVKLKALIDKHGAKKGRELYVKLQTAKKDNKKSTMDLLEDFEKLSEARERKKRSELKYKNSNHK